MGKIFYHNITKGLLNETDAEDFFSEYEDGDQVFKSEAGDATLIKLSKKELNKLFEECEIDEELEKALEELENKEECPECKNLLEHGWSGLTCPKCGCDYTYKVGYGFRECFECLNTWEDN